MEVKSQVFITRASVKRTAVTAEVAASVLMKRHYI